MSTCPDEIHGMRLCDDARKYRVGGEKAKTPLHPDIHCRYEALFPQRALGSPSPHFRLSRRQWKSKDPLAPRRTSPLRSTLPSTRTRIPQSPFSPHVYPGQELISTVFAQIPTNFERSTLPRLLEGACLHDRDPGDIPAWDRCLLGGTVPLNKRKKRRQHSLSVTLRPRSRNAEAVSKHAGRFTNETDENLPRETRSTTQVYSGK